MCTPRDRCMLHGDGDMVASGERPQGTTDGGLGTPLNGGALRSLDSVCVRAQNATLV